MVEAVRVGLEASAACRSMIEGLAGLRGARAAGPKVALLALDKQGRAGVFSVQPGFTYALIDAAGQIRIERAGALLEAP